LDHRSYSLLWKWHLQVLCVGGGIFCGSEAKIPLTHSMGTEYAAVQAALALPVQIFAVTPFVPGTAQPVFQRHSLRSVNSFCWHIIWDSNPSDLQLRGWLFCC